LRQLLSFCLLTILLNEMALAQSNRLSLINQQTARALPGVASQLDPKAQARFFNSYRNLPAHPTGPQAIQGFSSLPRGYESSVQDNFQSLAMDASAIFLEAPTYDSGGYDAQSIAVADLTGDGKLDVVVANANSVDVLLGNGDGTFRAAVSYGAGGSSVAVKDVNGDGKPDLLVVSGGDCTNCAGVVSVLLGNGDGTFQPAVAYGSGGYAAISLAVGDVNGDGKPDLLVANSCGSSDNCAGNGTVGVLLGKGDGTFQPAVAYSSGGFLAVSVAVGDVNGDGKPDLLVANQCTDDLCANGSVGVLLSNGNGTFQPAVAYSSGGYDAISVTVGDVNADGMPDVLVVNTCPADTNNACENNLVNGTVGVLLGKGDGSFQPAVTYNSGGYIPTSVALADVNGDGRLDVVVAHQCASGGNCVTGSGAAMVGTVSVLPGNGDGTFQEAASYGSNGYIAVSVAVGDVNGDGKPDLLVANFCVIDSNCAANGSVGVLFGNGDGSFRATVTRGSGGYDAAYVAVADVNRDGKPDLLVANQCTDATCTNGSVGVLLGKGDGTFQPAVTYSLGDYIPTSMATADFNGDGKLDLAVVNGSNTVSIFLGRGDGTFRPAVTCDLGVGAYSVAVGDVNGDGKPDLAVVNGNNTVSIFLGKGDGTFRPAVTYGSGGVGANSVAVADVNGDGKLDVLVANAGGEANGDGSVGVLLGNGDGTFQPAVAYSAGGYDAISVAVGDVNGDRRSDLLLGVGGAAGNGMLSVLLGNGDGTFQSAITTATPSGWYNELALADFNGDGKLDVASGYGSMLLLGNGDGTFQPVIPLGAGGPGIAAGDFSRDGKPDLAVGGVTILLNIKPHHRCREHQRSCELPGQPLRYPDHENDQCQRFCR
jgi:hypothetical protein